jgi:hypothetical protein
VILVESKYFHHWLGLLPVSDDTAVAGLRCQGIPVSEGQVQSWLQRDRRDLSLS